MKVNTLLLVGLYYGKGLKNRNLFCFGPPVCLTPPVTNYMLLYSALLCKKIARAPGGRKNYKPTKLGARNRIDPKIGRHQSALVLNLVFKLLNFYWNYL